jgi:hypothetical protein
MRSDMACFSDKKDLETVKTEIGGGAEMNWQAVREHFER